jgi:hypothetical protein
MSKAAAISVKPWRLALLIVLGLFFLWLAYSHLLEILKSSSFRAGGGLRSVFWIVGFVFLALCSLIGPIAFLSKALRRKEPNQHLRATEQAKSDGGEVGGER